MIEVNGPHHYLRGCGETTVGDRIKKRVLERQGYACVSVAYYDWVLLGEDARADYLLDLVVNLL